MWFLFFKNIVKERKWVEKILRMVLIFFNLERRKLKRWEGNFGKEKGRFCIVLVFI